MSSRPALDRPTLVGQHVTLEPLSLDHVDALVAAAADRSTYEMTVVPSDGAAMQAYVEALLQQHARGEVVPFCQRRAADGRVVGCTRYMTLLWWRGRPVPDEVEIGGTWLAADAQRTPVNTEAKLMLLTHAFEQWQVVRVALCTDARNTRSRAAIERIGARFEGILRSHRASAVDGEQGLPRDSAMFAITRDDWPEVRDALHRRLGRTDG